MMLDLLVFADKLISYLVNCGIRFNEHGFLIFEEGMLLKEEPQEVLPYTHRNRALNKAKTLVVFYEDDPFLYRRFRTLELDARRLSHYMGIGGFDLSPNIFWDIEQQTFNILLSQMYTAYMALQGIKIVPNFRIGSLETLKALNSYPKDAMFIAGNLGTRCNEKTFGVPYLRTKLIATMPKKLLIYGHLDECYKTQLNSFNIPYKRFDDYHTACKLKRRLAYGL